MGRIEPVPHSSHTLHHTSFSSMNLHHVSLGDWVCAAIQWKQKSSGYCISKATPVATPRKPTVYLRVRDYVRYGRWRSPYVCAMRRKIVHACFVEIKQEMVVGNQCVRLCSCCVQASARVSSHPTSAVEAREQQ